MSMDTSAPIYIGALFSTSGVMASQEKLLLSAAHFAVDEFNSAGGIEGRELKIVHYDPGSDPASYGRLANGLINEDNVKLIAGCYMSSARIAVKPVVEKHNALLFYPAQYEGFEYSSNIVYGGAVANQNCANLAAYISRNTPPRVFTVGSAYIWPRESARTLAELVSIYGGSVVEEAFFKLDAPRADFEDVIERIKRTNPDVIFCNLVGPTVSHFYRAYAAANLNPAQMPIVSLTTNETHIQEMGVEFGVGHITAAPYFQSVDTAANRDALARFQTWIDQPFVTNMGWEATYNQFKLLFRAIAQIGSIDVELLSKTLPTIEHEAPQGRISLDAETNHTYLWPRIGRVNKSGQFDILEESKMRVRPDPYLTRQQKVAWSLAHAT